MSQYLSLVWLDPDCNHRLQRLVYSNHFRAVSRSIPTCRTRYAFIILTRRLENHYPTTKPLCPDDSCSITMTLASGRPSQTSSPMPLSSSNLKMIFVDGWYHGGHGQTTRSCSLERFETSFCCVCLADLAPGFHLQSQLAFLGSKHLRLSHGSQWIVWQGTQSTFIQTSCFFLGHPLTGISLISRSRLSPSAFLGQPLANLASC